MGAARKKFTPQYRCDAAHLVIETGRTIRAVAQEMGVGEQLLGRWVAAERARMEDPPALGSDPRGAIDPVGFLVRCNHLRDRLSKSPG